MLAYVESKFKIAVVYGSPSGGLGISMFNFCSSEPLSQNMYVKTRPNSLLFQKKVYQIPPKSLALPLLRTGNAIQKQRHKDGYGIVSSAPCDWEECSRLARLGGLMVAVASKRPKMKIFLFNYK